MDIEYFVEDCDFKLVSAERVKCMKGNIVPSIWKELKEFVLNKFSNIELREESIIRAEYEFKFLIDLYDYFREGYESNNILCFTKGKKIEDISLEEYKEMLSVPFEELETNFEKAKNGTFIAYRLETIDLSEKAKELVSGVNKNIDLYGYKELEDLKEYIESQPKETYEDAKKYYCGYGILKDFSRLIKRPSLYLSSEYFYFNKNDWIRNVSKKIVKKEFTSDEVISEYNKNIEGEVYDHFKY